MNTFIISYDLLSPETYSDYEKVINYIKSHYSWAKPLKSVWLVKTSKTASQIRDELRLLVDSNDKVLVMDVSKTSWASYNLSQEVSNWMKNNI